MLRIAIAAAIIAGAYGVVELLFYLDRKQKTRELLQKQQEILFFKEENSKSRRYL